MDSGPDIERDFAVWTAYQWAQLVPDADSAAAIVAIRFIQAADKLAKSHSTTIRPWKRYGISGIADFRILALLRHCDIEGMPSHRIAEHLRFEPATVSSRLARLERHGHVRRADHPTNRRTHLVLLNANSNRLVDDMYMALVDNHKNFFGSIDEIEHEQLGKMLDRLTR